MLKICVYAISKNEEKFVERFCASAKDADLILIADTGSDDDTCAVAKAAGAVVYSIAIIPWRFDKARDAALALVPADFDVCVSLDLDEVLEAGWREEIERVWSDETTRLRYGYDWGNGIVFNAEKIHGRKGYSWKHPCHEYPTLDPRVKEVLTFTDKLLVTHLPDDTKSRGSYLELLEMSVKEDPYCSRNAFYYARELFFYGKVDEAITHLQAYLGMPTATWHHERAFAMRTLAKCFLQKNDFGQAEVWSLKAAAEAPYTREAWCGLAHVYYRQKRWEDCLAMAKRALTITHREPVYTGDPVSWNEQPYDLAAIALWNLGKWEEGLSFAQKALDYNPTDRRLQTNVDFFLEKLAPLPAEICVA